MKGLLTIISLLFFALSSYAGILEKRATSSYKGANQVNPLLTHRYCADPGVMVYKDTVYIYCTDDGDKPTGYNGENKFNQINALICISSKDLVNWTDHGKINVAGGSGAAKWASNSWAPHAVYKNINGKDKFFLYFANNGSGVGVLTSDSPTGPWKDPIGRALISGNLCRDVVWCFDPAAFVDQDGSGYLYFGGGVPNGANANPKTLRVIKLGNDMTSVVGNPTTIDAPCSFEDSGINKIGNTYYYSYCSNWNANGRMNNAGIMYMTSNSPMGPFTYKGEVLKNPGTFFEGSTGTNHHTIFELKGQYYIAYHTMTLEKKANGSTYGYRSTHIDSLPFSNGSFGQAKGTWEGPKQIVSLNPYTRVEAETMGNQAGILSTNGNDSGNSIITDINNGDWTCVKGVNFSQGLSSITVSVKSSSNTSIKVNIGSENGTTACNISIPSTNNQFREVSGNCSNISGTKDVYFVFGGNLSFDYWKAVGSSGASAPTDSQPSNPTTPTSVAVNNNNNNQVRTSAQSRQTTAPATSQQTSAPVSSAPVGQVGNGCYYIKNVNSNKYLQVASGSRRVEVSAKTGSKEQQWTVQSGESGYVTLKNGGNGEVLDVPYGEDENNLKMQTYSANGMSAQYFKIIKTSTANAFGIVSHCSSDTKGLDVYQSGKADHTIVIQYNHYGGANQIWNFESCSGGSSVNSGNTSNSATNQCGSYPCCKGCISYYEDEDGLWGVENNDWCKIINNCQQSSVEKCTGANQGYPCCDNCDTYYTDESGRWGVMNNDWCGIERSC